MSLNIISENSSFLEKTCRTCCRFDQDKCMGLRPIFYCKETGDYQPCAEFENVINDFFIWNLEIKPNDGLPQQMCAECIDRFVQVNIFRQQVTDSQKLLLSYISKKGNVSPNNIGAQDVSTIFIGDEHGYISPSKLIEYVGYEEDFFDSNSQCNAPQGDNFETNESDYLFNHPNQIDTRNVEKKIVNDNPIECNKGTDTSLLKTNELPNSNNFESEKNILIKCDVCMKFIPSLIKLKRHKLLFHTRRDYVCSICNKHLEQITQRKYYNHMNTHRPKEHKCSYCEKAFIQKVHLINHERTHTKEQPYECDECGKKYRQEITLQEHKLTHKDPFPWKCEICGKGLKSRSCLLAHMQCHKDGYQCEVCGGRYNQKTTLKKHMLKHTERGDKIYQCKFCFKSFRRPFQLGNHFHTYHLDNSNVKGSFRCAECDSRFESASDLIAHRSSHDKIERPFVCGSCGKCFLTKTSLDVHVDMVHLKQKSFSCIHCHKSFFDITNLNAHLKIHNNQEHTQYNCDECEKVFTENKSLQAHKISHSNENSFKCTFCEETFKYRNSLGDHVLSHFLNENEDSTFEEVQNTKDFKNSGEDFSSEYQLLDSVMEEY